MTVSLQLGLSVGATVKALDANKNPSNAVLSNITFHSSDEKIFTVSQSTTDAKNAVVVSVAAGAATLTYQATATEADGTVNQIAGSDSITITTVTPPATQLVAEFGTPFPSVIAPPAKP